jgi:geranylgeranyl reductase family protein
MPEPLITIVGAGPGGVICALRLAQHGIPVRVLERAVFPRDKICGDAISGKVVEVMNKVDPRLFPKFYERSTQVGCWGVTFVAPNGQAVPISFKLTYDPATQRAPGFLARRVDFDSQLVDEIRHHPLIELRENAEVTTLTRKPDAVEIQLKSGESLVAPLVIGADGAQSVVNRQLARHKLEPAHHCAGIRMYYQGVSGFSDEHFIELHFIQRLLPGYFWLFPLANGWVNVGLGMRTDVVARRKINLKDKLQEIIEREPAIRERFTQATPMETVKGFGLPMGSRKRDLSGDRFLLLGDAGSLIDPFTGEGIGNAMFSGWFAANHLASLGHHSRYSAADLKGYDHAVYQRLWPELRLSKIMQELIRFPWLFNFIVRKARRSPTFRQTLTCMFEDIDLRSRFSSPAFYWKLLWE